MKLRRLLSAIHTARTGTANHLEVKFDGRLYHYNPKEDEGLQKYLRARMEISQYPMLERILHWMKIL
jgi:hypothetical protein